jgi:hypothetical protein
MATPEIIIDLNKSPKFRLLELGERYASELRYLIDQARTEMLDGISGAVLEAALSQFIPFVRKSLRHHEYLTELEGLSFGSDIDINDLLLINVIYDLTAGLKWPSLGCTGFVHAGPPMPLIARAMDWNIPEGIGERSVILRYRADGYEVVTAGFPGVNGVISGLSSAGFAITVNHQTRSKAGLPNWEHPTLWCVREVLENGSNYADARRRLMKMRMASPAFLLLCGESPGEACLIETDGLKPKLWNVASGETQAISNHPLEGPLLTNDFEHGTSEERFWAMAERAAEMPYSDVEAAKKTLSRYPVKNDRTVHLMVLSPADKALHFRCTSLKQKTFSVFKIG